MAGLELLYILDRLGGQLHKLGFDGWTSGHYRNLRLCRQLRLELNERLLVL